MQQQAVVVLPSVAQAVWVVLDQPVTRATCPALRSIAGRRDVLGGRAERDAQRRSERARKTLRVVDERSLVGKVAALVPAETDVVRLRTGRRHLGDQQRIELGLLRAVHGLGRRNDAAAQVAVVGLERLPAVQKSKRLVERGFAAGMFGNTDADHCRACAAFDLEVTFEAVEIAAGVDRHALGFGNPAVARVVGGVFELENQPNRPIGKHA